MSKETVVFSDLSGAIIADGEAVKIRAMRGNKMWVLDVAYDEVADLLGKARELKRPGRPGVARKNGN